MKKKEYKLILPHRKLKGKYNNTFYHEQLDKKHINQLCDKITESNTLKIKREYSKKLHDYIFNNIKLATQPLLYKCCDDYNHGYESKKLFKILEPLSNDKYLLFKIDEFEEKIESNEYGVCHILGEPNESLKTESSYVGKMRRKVQPNLIVFFINIYEFQYKGDYSDFNQIKIGLNVLDCSFPTNYHHELILDFKNEFGDLVNVLNIKRIIEGLSYSYTAVNTRGQILERNHKVFVRMFLDKPFKEKDKIIPIILVKPKTISSKVLFQTQNKILFNSLDYHKALNDILRKENSLHESLNNAAIQCCNDAYNGDEEAELKEDNLKMEKDKNNLDEIQYLDKRKSFLISLQETYKNTMRDLKNQNPYVYEERIKDLYYRIDKIDTEIENINNELYKLFELDELFEKE